MLFAIYKLAFELHVPVEEIYAMDGEVFRTWMGFLSIVYPAKGKR